ncbi:MAG: hypothetical protein JXA99_04985 [Candidatus Lokiarchaeota archaeon]|nr:hypothetical protein [Candidatus Lokiarchaeota archaeon]
MKYYTIGQIDTIGTESPHQKELKDISLRKSPLFKNLDKKLISKISLEKIGGYFSKIGMEEDWTITLKFFPEVNIHISYFYYGDEFGDIESELKYLFSGERCTWIPGEDLATYISIVMNMIENQIKNIKPGKKNYNKKSELLLKIIKQRLSLFKLLKDIDQKEVEYFLGATIVKNHDSWTIIKEIFPEINVEIIYFIKEDNIDVQYSGKNLENIDMYHIELIAIFIINHILRFTVIKNQEKKLPNIAYMMFSRLFSKEKGWNYRNI